MKELCVRAAEFLGCYTLPYEGESGKEEIRFEDILLKASVSTGRGFEQKIIYCPLA
jgi:hypothetical protein